MSNFMGAAPNPLNDCPYWVGDVLVTMSEVSPKQRWPWTTWKQITDCMLRAADDTHPAGSTGGAWEIVQTAEQMPRHMHNAGGSPATAPNGSWFPAWSAVVSSTSGGSGGRYYPASVSTAGESQPMPIANKYTACYMWKRTG